MQVRSVMTLPAIGCTRGDFADVRTRHACDHGIYVDIVLAIWKVCPDAVVLTLACTDGPLLQQLPPNVSLRAQAIC